MTDKITILLTEEEIDKRIAELGAQITKEYEGKEITMVCILKGATLFACELAKRIDLPLEMEYMRCSSYGNETESSGVVKIDLDLDRSIRNKHILVVEDIIDTGRTMKYLLDILKGRGPADVKLCSLLDKPDRRV
ncbi:MAG: hypoxanthine phosphoribosyltransferase, partial [Lachnospiraceae bacterium]|nr:hypoxanthine phosphoribosyltransferase [Lachnospiraceae bacterium]